MKCNDESHRSLFLQYATCLPRLLLLKQQRYTPPNCPVFPSLNESAYLQSSSSGSTSATSPNFVFSGSELSTPTMRNCSGLPARSS
jgi:hypothetical protein